MPKKIVLRTHGGLGNQLFQVVYGRLFSKEKNLPLYEIHDDNYAHKFQRDQKLFSSPKPKYINKIISDLRLSKIIYKVNNIDGLPLKIMSAYYLDGYYQNLESFKSFKQENIRNVLTKIKKELNIKKFENSNTLVHLRLKDFFKSREEEIGHIVERLTNCPHKSHIITNNYELLLLKEVKEILFLRNLKIIDTKNFNASDLLKLISSYKSVESNNSTIAFWGSLLADSNLLLNDEKLKKLYVFFRRILQD